MYKNVSHGRHLYGLELGCGEQACAQIRVLLSVVKVSQLLTLHACVTERRRFQVESGMAHGRSSFFSGFTTTALEGYISLGVCGHACTS